MATDLYTREVDSLRFELSMGRCSDKLAILADEILLQGVYSHCLIDFYVQILIIKRILKFENVIQGPLLDSHL